MKRATIATLALAAAAFTSVAAAQWVSPATHSLIRAHENYVADFCGRMNDAARLAVRSAGVRASKETIEGLIYRIGERLVFNNLPDADDGVKETIKADYKELAAELVDRAYNPREYPWFTPESTNLCLWTLGRCIEHSRVNVRQLFPVSRSATVSANIGQRLEEFLPVCQPPDYNGEGSDCKAQYDDPFPGAQTDMLLGLTLSCDRKIGNFPSD